jgi:hypothetical protein
MPAIEVPETDIDDPAFVAVVSAFVSHYAELYAHSRVKIIQIDNWFGERWLGFAGKFLGIAGMRNPSLHTRLPAPPFRPSRVVSCHDFDLTADNTYTRSKGDFSRLHAEKNGGEVWHLHHPGLYCWYSGNTRTNTTACLMIYDVTRVPEGRIGYDAWYVQFDKKDEWEFTKCRNVSPQECLNILTASRGQVSHNQ